MKKFYRIIALLLALTFLTTYAPSGFNFIPKKENIFFEVQNIKIINNNIIEENKIIDQLRNIYKKNILFISKNEIVEPLKSIDFLEKIEVKKKYPNTIVIKIYETRPIAILFKKNEKYLLDSSANLISFNENMFNDNFPNVFGEEAEHNFLNFFKILGKNNFPMQEVKNYYYFQINRWDLELVNGKIIKFPPIELKQAVLKSIELLNREDFKNYRIIDLRVSGKVVVE